MLLSEYDSDTVPGYSGLTLIYRDLVKYSRGDIFDKKLVEARILSWMPFKVRKTYITSDMQE